MWTSHRKSSFHKPPAYFRALPHRWWTVTSELTSRGRHWTTDRESDDHVTTAHQWQASQPRGGERSRQWTHYQHIHVPAQCHSDEREHVRSCRSHVVNDRWWWTGWQGDGVEWEVGFWLPLVRTIGLTTEEGGEEERSAGFKERQTDESYSNANHPLYTCVCVCGNMCGKVSVSVFWGTSVGSFAGGRLIAHLSFCQLRGYSTWSVWGGAIRCSAAADWRMGWWHTQTHAQIWHLSRPESRISQKVYHGVCVWCSGWLYVWLYVGVCWISTCRETDF